MPLDDKERRCATIEVEADDLNVLVKNALREAIDAVTTARKSDGGNRLTKIEIAQDFLAKARVFEVELRRTVVPAQETVARTRSILLNSDPWKELTSKLDVMKLAAAGPIDMETWDPLDHQMAREWANGRRSIPYKIAEYVATVEDTPRPEKD